MSRKKVIEMQGVYKYFGSFCANENVDFDVEEGEVHGLLGENGAGKSTLMNVLYGLYTHDQGIVKINGEEVNIKSPSDAIKLGVGMVHQHFMLIPQLTVTQNIFLGMSETGFVLKMKSLEQQVQEVNDKYGFNVKPNSVIWQLPVGIQQKVEILKVLLRKGKILILDEPTAVLTPSEVEELFMSVKKLAKQGYSIILITHKLEEIMEYTDRVTVLRSGKVIGTVSTSETNNDELTTMMVGRDVSLERDIEEQTAGAVLLEVKDLVVKSDKDVPAVKGVSFKVKAGEILGIAGVDGNGQLELGEAITGLRKIVKGTISINGSAEMSHVKPKTMLSAGLGHIPDDRHKKGLVLPFGIKENLIMGSQRSKKYNKGIFVNSKAIDKHAAELIADFDIRCRGIDQPAGDLSGGNQQKVILAREVDRNPDILLAIQPTRGLDIGAIEFVRGKLKEARANGKAVLLISTDLDEIRTLSDRIAVMYNGNFSGEVNYNAPLKEIGMLMAGVNKSKNAEAWEGEDSE